MNNICQKCKKARATVHLTEIDPENNEPTEMHLCEACARDSGSPSSGSKSPQSVTFTASLIGLQEKASKPRSAASKLACPGCGMTYQEFRVKGRFGCIRCYDTFAENLEPLLERVHGATQYVGPQPGSDGGEQRTAAAMEQELVDLRRRLNRVVKEENYEEAARIRDRIAEVERGLLEAKDG